MGGIVCIDESLQLLPENLTSEHGAVGKLLGLCIEEAGMGDELLRVPEVLIVDTPRRQPACAGQYELVPDCTANGQPLWRLSRTPDGGKPKADRWLYSSDQDSWNIGGRKSQERNFQCHEAHVYLPVEHNGIMPHKLDGVWSWTDGRVFHPDPEICVTAADVEWAPTEGAMVFGVPACAQAVSGLPFAKFGGCLLRPQTSPKAGFQPLPEQAPPEIEREPSEETAAVQPGGREAVLGVPVHSEVVKGAWLQEQEPDPFCWLARPQTDHRAPAATRGRSCAARGLREAVCGTPLRRLASPVPELKLRFWLSRFEQDTVTTFAFRSYPLGIEFDIGTTPLVVMGFSDDSIAFRTGVRKGMVLAAVADQDISRMTFDEAFDLLREECSVLVVE